MEICKRLGVTIKAAEIGDDLFMWPMIENLYVCKYPSVIIICLYVRIYLYIHTYENVDTYILIMYILSYLFLGML